VHARLALLLASLLPLALAPAPAAALRLVEDDRSIQWIVVPSGSGSAVPSAPFADFDATGPQASQTSTLSLSPDGATKTWSAAGSASGYRIAAFDYANGTSRFQIRFTVRDAGIVTFSGSLFSEGAAFALLSLHDEGPIGGVPYRVYHDSTSGPDPLDVSFTTPLAGGEYRITLLAEARSVYPLGTQSAANYDLTITLFEVVPEPGTATLLLAGLVAAGCAGRARSSPSPRRA
jgi:hypothetical protein